MKILIAIFWDRVKSDFWMIYRDYVMNVLMN